PAAFMPSRSARTDPGEMSAESSQRRDERLARALLERDVDSLAGLDLNDAFDGSWVLAIRHAHRDAAGRSAERSRRITLDAVGRDHDPTLQNCDRNDAVRTFVPHTHAAARYDGDRQPGARFARLHRDVF